MLIARCGTYETAIAEARIFGDENPDRVYHVYYVDERVPGTMMWGFWAVDDITDKYEWAREWVEAHPEIVSLGGDQ